MANQLTNLLLSIIFEEISKKFHKEIETVWDLPRDISRLRVELEKIKAVLDDVEETALHHATKGMEEIMEDGPKSPHQQNPPTPLSWKDYGISHQQQQANPSITTGEKEEILVNWAWRPRKKDLARSIQLLEENPDIESSTENPLHMAARLGKFEWARKILLRNPRFARDLNQDGDSPLHLAAANGFVEIVREILKVGPDMCFLRDKDGRTALHRAAIKGRVEVVNELLRESESESALDATTTRGDTALHLALAYGQTEAFRLLVEWVKHINKKEVINCKDREGNTVLHVATSRKQLQAIEVLLDGQMISTREVEVNALNACGLTALDILYVLPQSLGEMIDMEIEDVLRRAGGLRSRDIISQPPHFPNQFVIDYGTALSQKSPALVSPTNVPTLVRTSLLVVAVMILIVTYDAVNSGAWKEVYSKQSFQPRKQNLDLEPIAFTLPMSIRLFAVFNSAGFFASIALIMVLISGFPMRPLLLIAAFSLLVSYMCLIEAMLPTEVLFVLLLAIPFVSFAVTQYIFPRRGWGSSKFLKLKWRNLGKLTGL